MTRATVAGQPFELDVSVVERAVASIDPEPIREHYVVIGGRRLPPKQVLAIVTGLDRADFTTHQARAVLRRLGFGVYRRSRVMPSGAGAEDAGPATALQPFIGRWVAQEGDEVMYDADTPEEVMRWLRRHGRRARVWRIPGSPGETGSALSVPSP